MCTCISSSHIDHNKGAFKYYAILLEGGRVTKKITEDHKGRWRAKELAKLKLLKKEMIAPRVVQEVISS